MITVAPSAEFETSVDWGVTGLTGTLRVSLLDGDGAVTTAATTAGIAEFPTGSGRYEVTLTAPGTAGQYAVFWDNGAQTIGNTAVGDDVLVTSDGAASVGGTTNLYVSRSELKATMGLTVTTYDDDIDLVITAASRAIDGYKNTRYFPTTETRYYDPPCYGSPLEIDDLNSLTSVKLDPTGSGAFGTTLTSGTDFALEPVNNPATGAPYRSIRLLPQSAAIWPTYPNSVQVIGSFGWAETPILVKQACKILAQRLYARKDSPMGILAVGVDGAAVHLRRTDPDVAFMLDQVDSNGPRFVA